MRQTSRVMNPPFDFTKLTTAEKLALIEQLWDSIEGDDAPFTEEQRLELERRMGDYERTREPGTPWPIVRDRLLKRPG